MNPRAIAAHAATTARSGAAIAAMTTAFVAQAPSLIEQMQEACKRESR
jgi:hypothetical protein